MYTFFNVSIASHLFFFLDLFHLEIKRFSFFLCVGDPREALLKGVTRVLGVNVLDKLDVLLRKTDLKLADRADGELGRGLLSLSDLTSLSSLLLSQLAKVLSRLGHFIFKKDFCLKMVCVVKKVIK